jgi:hypothetical protein
MRMMLIGAALLAIGSGADATTVFQDDFNDHSVAGWTLTNNYDFAANAAYLGIAASNATAVRDADNAYLETFLNLPQSTPTQNELFVRATHTVTIGTAGDYTLSFTANSAPCQGCIISYDALFDGVLLTRASTYPAFVLRSLALTGVTAGAHTLTLGMHTTGASSGLFIARFDDVAIDSVQPLATVPEPAAWSLLIAGFALTGAALRRRALTFVKGS